MSEQDLRAVESEVDRQVRFSDNYNHALDLLVKEASPEELGDAVGNWYEHNIMELFHTDPIAFVASVKRSLRNSLSGSARIEAEDKE